MTDWLPDNKHAFSGQDPENGGVSATGGFIAGEPKRTYYGIIFNENDNDTIHRKKGIILSHE